MKRIVILHRGWVVVGNFSEDNGWGVLQDAAVIRRWGTSKGLGELAQKGPQSETILDPTPQQRFPLSAVINTIDCNEEAWS